MEDIATLTGGAVITVESGISLENVNEDHLGRANKVIVEKSSTSTFKRRIHSSGRHRIAWCCSIHIVDIKKCSMKYVPESDFEYAFVTMMNKLIFGHEFVLKPLLISLRGMNSDETLESIHAIDKKLEENVEQRNVLVGLMTKKYLDLPFTIRATMSCCKRRNAYDVKKNP